MSMTLAKACALSSPCTSHHIGAVLKLRSGERYLGFNQPKSHPLQKKFGQYHSKKPRNSYLHAEIHAIAVALRNHKASELTGSKLYVYRLDLKSNYAMCRPCAVCLAALRFYKIQDIFYTTPESEFCHERLSLH